MSDGFVILMGLGVVFVGLICIIFVCMFMSFCIRKFEKKPSAGADVRQQSVNANAPAAAQIPSRPELAAAIAAAIAEYTGKDISGIRILSIKKL